MKQLPQNPCPRCRKPADWYDNPFRPFCSERCKLIDLGAWVDGTYRIPGEHISSENEKPDDSTEEKGK